MSCNTSLGASHLGRYCNSIPLNADRVFPDTTPKRRRYSHNTTPKRRRYSHNTQFSPHSNLSLLLQEQFQPYRVVIALMNRHSPRSYMPNGNFPPCLQPFAVNRKSKCNIDRTHQHMTYELSKQPSKDH